MIGRTLGSYQLQAHIGSGGMGVVYLAEHKLIGRKAAVKVLLPEYSARQDLIRRFFNEAKAAASAQHPGIVEVYDFGRAPDGTAYLVMELLEGDTLWQRLRREKRLPERDALLIARQIAAALAAAHQAGVIHRDLKPGNIFLLESEDSGLRVKLMDFGVAKLMRDDSAAEGLTTTGAIVGTPVYMSPEQCRGGGTPIDWRSDIYSLGCILFAMLAGRPPFVADGSGAVLAMHIYEPTPRVKDFHPVSDDVDRLVQQLLSKRPDERAREIREVAGILAQLAPTEEGRSRLAATLMAEDAVTAPRATPPEMPASTAAMPAAASAVPAARGKPPPVAFPRPATTLRTGDPPPPAPAQPAPIGPLAAQPAPIGPLAALARAAQIGPPAAVGPPGALGAPVAVASPVAVTVPAAAAAPPMVTGNRLKGRSETPGSWPDGTPTARTTLPPRGMSRPLLRRAQRRGGGPAVAAVLGLAVLGAVVFAAYQLGVFGGGADKDERSASPPAVSADPVDAPAEAPPITVVKDPAQVAGELPKPPPAASEPAAEQAPAAAEPAPPPAKTAAEPAPPPAKTAERAPTPAKTADPPARAEDPAPARPRSKKRPRPPRREPRRPPPGTTEDNVIDPFD